jgi:hypothetical protein
VSAYLQNMPVEDALNQITSAAGAKYRKELLNGKDTYIFSSDSSQAAAQMQYSPYRPGQALQQSPANNSINDTVRLNYINSAAVMPMANAQQDVQVANSGSNFLVLRGAPDAVKSFKGMVAAVDRPESMPRAVRVKATVQVAVTQKTEAPQPVISRAETESVGVEGMLMPLTIGASRSPRGSNLIHNGDGSVEEVKDPTRRDLDLRLDLTPTVLASEPATNTAGQTISLTGHGMISGYLPIQFSKDFDFAVSVIPPAKATIAQGNVEIDGSSVAFTVTISANVEKGRVQLPANGIQGGYGNSIGNGYAPFNQKFGNGSAGYGGGGYGSSYGGYGGGYGSSYGGAMQNQQGVPPVQAPIGSPRQPVAPPVLKPRPLAAPPPAPRSVAPPPAPAEAPAE